MEARAGRPAAGKPSDKPRPLNRQRVLEAALTYVDRYGLAGLTMRRLGTELGVEGMSLYKHVADKGALLDGIVELLWAEVSATPPPGTGWRDALRQLAGGLRDVFHRHPNSAPLLATRSFVNIETLRCYEAFLDVVRRAGFDRRRALDAVGAVVGQALGYALLELRYQGETRDLTEPESDIQRIRRLSRTLPADAPDSLVELAAELTRDCDGDRCFTISIEALLDGLAPEPAR